MKHHAVQDRRFRNSNLRRRMFDRARSFVPTNITLVLTRSSTNRSA